MKIAKYASIILISIVIGAVAGGLFVGRFTSRIANPDMVSWDVDRILHLVWLTEGKTDDVIDVSMTVLEESITRTDYHEEYPGTVKQVSLMADWIPNIYANTGRKMPKHVSAWIDRHKNKSK